MPSTRQRLLGITAGLTTLLAGSLALPVTGVASAQPARSRSVLFAHSTLSGLGASVDESVVRLPAVAPAPAAPTASPSGVSAPRGDLPGWNQVYAEDFGTPNATGSFPSAGYERHWDVYQDGWKDTSHNGTYMPSKVLSVHGGVLDYDVRTENGQHLVAAPWLTDTSGHTYGRYSVRFRADALPGYKTAWLLWPDSESWPAGGEIDFPEGNLGRTDTISAFSHHASAAGGQEAFGTHATFAAWHTVTVEWVPGKVTFVLDGKVIGVSTTMVPSTAMHWVLQTETSYGTVPADSTSGHVYIDWVAQWSKI